MFKKSVCLNCNNNLCFNSDVLCRECEQNHEGWSELDKIETRNSRDEKGNRIRKKCVLKIKKLKNDYRLLRTLQRDTELLKKKVIEMQMNMEFMHSQLKNIKENQHNLYVSKTIKENTPLGTSTPIIEPINGRLKCRRTYREDKSFPSPINPMNSKRNNKLSEHHNYDDYELIPESNNLVRDEDRSDNEEDIVLEANNLESDEDRSDNEEENFAQDNDKNHKPSCYPNQKEVKYINEQVLRRRKDSEEDTAGNNSYLIFFGILFIIVVMIISNFLSPFLSPTEEPVVGIKELKKQFPHQNQNTWDAIESGINEVKEMNKPSVFIFLYDKKTDLILNEFIKKISTFASCVLKNHCSFDAAVLKGDNLDTLKSEDYGFIIDKFQSEVEEKSVMVVYNLEKIPGEMAQAFHTFCDEYNPLVKKSIYFFTMKVNVANEENTSSVEKILRKKWDTLKDDIFDPLFTRISNMILPLQPES